MRNWQNKVSPIADIRQLHFAKKYFLLFHEAELAEAQLAK